MNVWLMIPVSSILVTRWVIAFHELFHLKQADGLDWITRLVPIAAKYLPRVAGE